MKKQTVRIHDEEFYKKVKIHLIETGMTFQDYVIKLITDDLKKSKK